nr:7427_t:CDS:2 [Entrophospora candida]
MERKPHFDNFSDDELISWKVSVPLAISQSSSNLKLTYHSRCVDWSKAETTIDEKWKKVITILNKDDELKLWRLVMKLPPVGFILNLHEGQSQLASVPRTTHSFTAPNDSFGSALKQKRLDRLLKKKREDSCSVTDDVTDKNNIDACSVTNDVADKDDTDALPTKKNCTDGVGFVTNANKFQFVYVEGNYRLNEVDSTNLHSNFHRCKDLYIFMKYIEVGAFGSDVTISFDEARTK